MNLMRQKKNNFIEWQYEVFSIAVYFVIKPTFLLGLVCLFILTGCNSSSKSSDSASISSPSFTVNVDIGDVPLTVDFDTSISPSDASEDDSNKEYFWDFGDGNSAEGLTVSHQYVIPGTYEATLLISENNSIIERSEPQIITVLPTSTETTAAFRVNTTYGVTPVIVDFDASESLGANGNIVSYEWDFGDSSSSNGMQTTHKYFLEGSHTARLTITDSNGEQDTTTQTIVVDGNGGTTISGNINFTENFIVDTDVNDLNSDYKSNNTLETAQVLPVQDSHVTWGYVTKHATNIAGQRFSERADEVDIYRTTLAAGQQINLEIKTHSDENGFVNANDIDLFLYSVNNHRSPIDSSLGTGESESVTAPVEGEYFIIVSAFSGRSSYSLSTSLTTSYLNTIKKSKLHLSLSSEFVAGQVIAKLKQNNINTSISTTDDSEVNGQTIQNIRQQQSISTIDTLSHRNKINLIKGNAGGALLFSINKRNETNSSSNNQNSSYQLIKNNIISNNENSLFDGRYGFELSDKEQQAYEIIKTVKHLRADDSIQYAEPNYIQKINTVPNDALYDSQWHYPAINLEEAWDITTGDASVIVAVIDTGVFMAHEDLSGNLLTTGYDFIASASVGNDGDGIDSNPDDPGDNVILSKSSWHGTHVAGTIAANINNGIGVAGVAPGVRIMPIRTLGVGGGSSYDVSQSILYASGLDNDSNTKPEQAADIINLSLGGKWHSQSQADAISAAQEAGVIIIASAGNNNSDDDHYPANYPGVVSVGAVGRSNERAYYSNYGSEIDLVAPGGDDSIDADGDGRLDSGILSTFVNTSSGSRQSGYKSYQGTSMSTPHVTGVIALMKSIYPDLTPDLLNTMIANGLMTIDLNNDGENIRNNNFGYGLIDARKAVQLAETLASGFIPQEINEIDIVNEIDNMLISTQQKILIKRISGSSEIIDVYVDMPWATLAPMSLDENEDGIVDGDGTGEYKLSIDRAMLEEGKQWLRVTVVMDTGDEYSKDIAVTKNQVTQIDTGAVYLILMDEWTREVVHQQQITIDATDLFFNIDNINNGNYLLIAGTDFDGDKNFENSELIGTAGGIETPTVYTIDGNDITDVVITLGTSQGFPVELAH